MTALSLKAMPAIAVALQLLTASPAMAQRHAPSPEAQKAEQEERGDTSPDATVHFERGVSAFSDGDFAGALYEFELAHEASGNFRILYNIGVCDLELHRYAKARTAFEQYLIDGGDQISPGRKAKVRERLATIETRVGNARITSTPDGANVVIEGEVVGVTPLDLTLDIGPTQLELTLDGYQTESTRVRVIGGETAQLDVELTPLEAIVVTEGPKLTPEQEAMLARANKLRLGSLVSLGITGVMGIGAIVTGSLALQAEGDLDSELEQLSTPSDLDDIHQRKQALAVTTDVLIGVTAAAFVVAGSLGIAHLRLKRKVRSSSTSAATLRLHPGGLTVRF